MYVRMLCMRNSNRSLCAVGPLTDMHNLYPARQRQCNFLSDQKGSFSRWRVEVEDNLEYYVICVERTTATCTWHQPQCSRASSSTHSTWFWMPKPLAYWREKAKADIRSLRKLRAQSGQVRTYHRQEAVQSLVQMLYVHARKQGKKLLGIPLLYYSSWGNSESYETLEWRGYATGRHPRSNVSESVDETSLYVQTKITRRSSRTTELASAVMPGVRLSNQTT